MPRRHVDAPAGTACIWVTDPDDAQLWDGVAAKLLCWADDSSKVVIATSPTAHFEVPKSLCGTSGVLKFAAADPDACPLPDDTDVATVDQLDPTTCLPVGDGGAVTSVAGKTGAVVLDAGDISTGVFAAARIPNLDAAKITTGILAEARVPDLPAAKVTSGIFDTARIPNLDASKINAGVLDDARVPNFDASKIVSGVFDLSQLPGLPASKTTSGTFADARIPALGAEKIASGQFDPARIPDLSTLYAGKAGNQFTGTQEIIVPNASTSALIYRQNATVISSDAEMRQAWYKTFKGNWDNEKAQLRTRRVDLEVVVKNHGRGNDATGNNNDIEQWLVDDGAGADVVRARVTGTGRFTATNVARLGAIDYGFLAWNFDPLICAGAGTVVGSPGAGTVRVAKIHIPYDMTVTNLHLNLGTAGAGLTSGQCHIGLFTSARALLSEATTGFVWSNPVGPVVALDVLWAGPTTGMLEMPLTTPQVVTAGFYYIGFYFNGTTGPAFFSAVSTKNGLANGRLTTNYMHASADTGRTTTMPNPLATLNLTTVAYWVAVS